MVITMLVSSGVLMMILLVMLILMNRRQKAVPRGFEPPIIRPNSHGTTRASGEDD